MNIFYLDENPFVAAKYMCDKHVVKMICETCVLLNAAVALNNGRAPMKIGYQNHPCSVWARKNKSNYNWLCRHLEGLLAEYTNRYKKEHAFYKYLDFFKNNESVIPDGNFTDPPKCMPDHCKKTNTVDSYRNYYRIEKSYFAKWKNGMAPNWFLQN